MIMEKVSKVLCEFFSLFIEFIDPNSGQVYAYNILQFNITNHPYNYLLEGI